MLIDWQQFLNPLKFDDMCMRQGTGLSLVQIIVDLYGVFTFINDD